MKNPKLPIGDILILLFLTIYCWRTLSYAIYKEGFARGLNLVRVFGFEGSLIFGGLPIIFGIGVYRMNKKYFDKLFKNNKLGNKKYPPLTSSTFHKKDLKNKLRMTKKV